MKKTTTIEGYDVVIVQEKDKFIAHVPKLPGCSIQATSESNAKKGIKRAIGDYLVALANLRRERPRMPKRKEGGGSGKEGNNKIKHRR